MLKPLATLLATLGLLTSSVHAVRIDDLTRLGGERTNTLIGKGLVVGLKGTGDGGKNPEMVSMLGQMLAKMGNAVSPEDLKDTKNVAVVLVTVTLPENGVRDGEHIDVHVASSGGAASLKGGRLFITALYDQGYGPYVARVRDANGRISEQKMPFGIAQGPIVVEDLTNPLVGVVRDGATMEVDLPSEQIDRAGRITLAINDPSASWTTANAIATAINSKQAGDGNAAGADIATAIDPKNVVVTIPQEYRGHPDAFIADLLRTELTLEGGEARVIINDRTGSMILTGDVEISPVIVSHRGLMISTIQPEPKPTDAAPIVKQSEFAALSTDKSPSANTGRLQDLLDALDQLKVPAEDKIAIVKQLYEIGKLHARLIVE